MNFLSFNFKCFFVGGNNSDAVILADDIVISEDGRFNPEIVDRKLTGEYTCALGQVSHNIQINVFPSENEQLV